MSSITGPALKRVIVDLATAEMATFDALVNHAKSVDTEAKWQTFDQLKLGVIAYRDAQVENLANAAYKVVGSLGDVNKDKNRFVDKVREKLGLPPLDDHGKLRISKPGGASATHTMIGPRAAAPPLVTPRAAAPSQDPWQITVCNLSRAVRKLTGRGIAVGIVDSGVDITHAAFRGVPMTHVDFWRDGAGGRYDVVTAPVDRGHGHGTMVASIIVGRDPSGDRLGIAPDCTFYSAGVANRTALEWDDIQLITALDWFAQQKVRIVNVSLAGTMLAATGHEMALNAARRCGMLPVVGIGNDGCNRVTSPGLCASALSIGSLRAADTVEDCSGCAKAPDASKSALPKLLVPGKLRVALTPNDKIEETPIAETSYATAYASGIIALLLEASPCASVDQLEAALVQSTTISVAHPKCTDHLAPILNFDAALEKLRSFGLPCRDLSI